MKRKIRQINNADKKKKKLRNYTGNRRGRSTTLSKRRDKVEQQFPKEFYENFPPTNNSQEELIVKVIKYLQTTKISKKEL